MTRRAERWIWIVAALGVCVTMLGAAVTPAVTPADASADARPRVQATEFADTVPSAGTPAGVGDLAQRVVARDPFRLDRRPASVPFGAEEPSPVAEPPRPARPALQLSGVSGPPWQAVLEGLPGHEGGVVAREGDRFADLHVRLVRADSVIVDARDTTWVLRVRRAW